MSEDLLFDHTEPARPREAADGVDAGGASVARTATQKRGGLFGGAMTEEALSSSRKVLASARGGASLVGLQQYFTPPEVSDLVAAVVGKDVPALDPTAGSGALLSGIDDGCRYGIEIDPDHAGGDGLAAQAHASPYEAINGDAQKVVPLMRAAGLLFPAVLCNPPFGLTWHDPAHHRKEIPSTALAFLWALDLMESFGQGVLVCGTRRLAKEVLSRPEARAVYAVVDVEGPLFEGVTTPVSIAFFVRPDNIRRRSENPSPVRIATRREELAEKAYDVRVARASAADFVARAFDAAGLDHAFRTVRAEHERRAKVEAGERAPRSQDVTLAGRRIRVSPSPYARLALARAGRLRELELLSRQNVSYFGQNKRDWRKLRALEADGLITLSPALTQAAEAAIEEAEKVGTPLFPLKPPMRLGWLTDLDRIPCKKADPARGFEEGEVYDLHTASKLDTKTEKRIHDNRYGEPELRTFTEERKLLEVKIDRHSFDESNENIAYIVEHFDLPDPGCVATRFPERMRENRNLLSHIARKNNFKLKPFQLDHLSRLLIKGRGMLAHEPGLGKTLQQMCLAEAQVKLGAKPCALFVSPQDLVLQTNRECKKFFGRRMEHIKTIAHARDVARRVDAGEPGWWITHFEALSLVGRKKEPLPETYADPKVALMSRLRARKVQNAVAAGKDPSKIRVPGSTGATTRFACPGCRADTARGWNGEVCRSCGHVHRRKYVKPAYSHLTTAFKEGVVLVDEVSEIRGDSIRSRAVRALARAHHPYGATGTPLSNFITDAFYGLSFCLGAGSAAFPYDHGPKGKAKFEADFAVVEHLHGRADDGEEHLRKRRKILPQITNVSQFWRLAQPGISRCRKEQTGEPLAERVFYPVSVPMGVSQHATNVFWLEHFPEFFAWKRPNHPLVKEGLHERFAAGLGQRWALEFTATLPGADPRTLEWPRAQSELGEPSNFTPANLKVLELALEHAARGEKVLIGSDLIETGRWISERLQEKNVRAVHITEQKAGKIGTKNPRKRAADVAAFVEGDAQVLCAGTSALKLGHNLQVASTVILTGLPDSWMMFSQFLDRVHRLTSEKPVSVYVIIPRGSLAERKWQLLKDKGGTSDLAFDGELSVKPEKPIDWRKEIEEMKKRGIRASGDEVLEADVEEAWRATAPLRPVFAPRKIRNHPPGSSGLLSGPQPVYDQPALFDLSA